MKHVRRTGGGCSRARRRFRHEADLSYIITPHPVDPYAIVTVGSDRLAVTKETTRLDNTAAPSWGTFLDFGCVEMDSKISFKYADLDAYLPGRLDALDPIEQ